MARSRPASRITGRSVVPARGGAFTLEGTDASGARIFSLSFEPVDVAQDVPGNDQHFAFVVPVNDADQSRLQTLRVRALGIFSDSVHSASRRVRVRGR